MKNIFVKKLYIFYIILFIFLTPQNFSLAYEPKTTHAGLTNQIVNFYNLNFSKQIDDPIKELIIQGSIDEDSPAFRVINHFYDPIRNIGINGSRTSKQWVFDDLDNEYSWNNGIKYYAQGDNEKAFLSLGHVLHLIEDMTVPDHTRNDPHIGVGPVGLYTGESPYENWSDKNKDTNSLSGLANVYKNGGERPKVLSSLENYFDFLANYSNNNFFSADTIANYSYKYDDPKINEIKKGYGYSIDQLLGDKFKIIIVKDDQDGSVDFKLIDQKDTSVLSEYFSRLGKQAVLSGAGVINLFFNEAEKARSEYLAQQEQKRKADIVEAQKTAERLNDAGVVTLVIEGAKDIFIAPSLSRARALASGFDNGSRIAISGLGNASSMVAFTAQVIFGKASNLISEIFKYQNGAKLNSASILDIAGFSNIKADGVDPINNSDSSITSPTKILAETPILGSEQNIVVGEEDISLGLDSDDVALSNLGQTLVGIETILKSIPNTSISNTKSNNQSSVDVINSKPQSSEPVKSSVLPIIYWGGGSRFTPVAEESIANQATPVIQIALPMALPETLTISSIASSSATSTIEIAEEETSTATSTEVADISETTTATTTEATAIAAEAVATTTSPVDVSLLPSDTSAPDSPIIISPANNSLFNISVIIFSGTAEASSTISTDFSSATTSADQLGNWSLSLSLADGQNQIKFFSTDASLNISSSSQVTINVDTQAPTVFLTVSSCQNSLSPDSCLTLDENINIEWSSSASDIDHFVVNENGQVSTTIATSTTIQISNGSNSTFSVYAIDTAGNQSNTASQTIAVDTMPVVINEVSWAGSSATGSEDEWIELYNRSNKDINLNNFVLYSATDMSPYIQLSGNISAGSYYLIERKNTGETDEVTQSAVLNISADLWTSFGSGLINSGENLILSFGSTTVDQMIKCNNWCAGSSASYITAERVDPEISGATVSNWMTNLQVIKNGVGINNVAIKGTPKARNSVNYLLNKGVTTINSDLILKKDRNPYLVTNSMNLSQNKTLTLEEGVIIKMLSSTRFSADGNVVVLGTTTLPVVITSFEDDLYGGDLNGDGVCGNTGATCPLKGSWYGLELSNKSASSSFNNLIIRYGGKDGSTSNIRRANLYVDSVSPSITNSTIEYSGVYGLYLKNSTAIVNNNIFQSNASSTQSTGLYINSGAPTISNNYFSKNDYALRMIDSRAIVSDNNFVQNFKIPIWSSNALGDGYFYGNSGSSNTNNYIQLSGNITSTNSTTTFKTNPMPYFLDGVVGVVANSTLIIDNGVNIKGTSNGTASKLSVSGKLFIDTPTIDGVTFSSILPNPTTNSWNGILFNASSGSFIKGVTIKDAKIGLEYVSSKINLENVLLSNDQTGVKASGGYTVEKAVDVQFQNNTTNKSPTGLW